MKAICINPGDKAFITRPLPPGSVKSLYNIYGASGAGTIIEAGASIDEALTFEDHTGAKAILDPFLP